ncbi:hypothetical protein DXG01_010393 [Tephrocybe rancida]|nr:hypothetical protein DXG01_010393 [Tephrocybe rancida]
MVRPVILLGHSMGGLLAAEAATHASMNSGAKSSRIIGMIAFDTPYLGMHPHVVITGIASLFRDDGGKGKTDAELNDTKKVTIVDAKVTDDWDAFKGNLSPDSRPVSVSSGSSSRLPSSQPSSPFSFVDRTVSFLSSHSEDPLVRWARKHADDPFSASKRWVVERFQFGSCMFDPNGLKDRYSRLVGWKGGVWVNYWTQTVPRPKIDSDPTAEQKEAVESDEALNREVTSNDSQPLSPPLPVVPPHTQPPPPYEEISGMDVEYFPTTNEAPSAPAKPPPLPPRKSAASIMPAATSPPLPPRSPPVLGAPTKSEADTARKVEQQAAKDLEKKRKQAEKEQKQAGKDLKKEQKLREKEQKDKNKAKPGYHFIVLPTGLGQVLGGGENWEKVLIGGVEDEVAAHCGLFIRGQNLDYDGLVERVAQKVLGWCEDI